jgi:Photosynthesis system II assembly factor YCF48
MRDESARDKAIQNLTAEKLRSRMTSGNGCPDAEIIAAYFERILAPKDRARWEAHFDSCAACQQRIAALVRMDEADEANLTHAPRVAAPERRNVYSPRWLWAAPALVAVLVAGLWFTGEFSRIPIPPTETTPLARQPASAPAKTAEKQAAGHPSKGAAAEMPKTIARAKAPPVQATAASAKDELKTAMNSPVQTSGQAGRFQAPKPQPPALETVTPKGEREAESTSIPAAATESGGAGHGQAASAAPVTPPSANEQGRESIKPLTESVEVRAEAPQVESAPPPGVSAAKVSAKRSEAADALGGIGGTGQLAKARAKSTEESMALRSANFSALVSTPGIHYTSSPGMTTRDGVTVPASLWRVGRHGLIEHQNAQGEWETKPSGVAVDLSDITFPSHEVGWAVGQDGTVLRSANAGKSWGRVTSPTDEDLVRVHATSAESAQVTTRSGAVFATTDGAATWTRVESTQ